LIKDQGQDQVPCSAHASSGEHDNKPLSSWRPSGAAWLWSATEQKKMKHSRVSAKGDGLSNDTRKKKTHNIIQRIQLQRIMRHFIFRTHTNTL